MAYNLKSFLAYRQRLEACANENSPEIIYNDSIVHAAMVYNQLFKKALENNTKSLNIFCGIFSILRDSTRCKIAEELNRIRPQQDSEDFSDWESFKPFEELEESVQRFFNEKGKLNVIIEKRSANSYAGEQSFPLLKEAYETGSLYVRTLPFPIGLDHFAVTGNAYRCENSDTSKTALCCFNDDNDIAKVLMKSFLVLEKMSEPFTFGESC